MALKYFKAQELGYSTEIYIRAFAENNAVEIFKLFKREYPTPEKGPLIPVSYWKGWWRFHGVSIQYDVVWQEFEPGADLYQKATSYRDLMESERSRRPNRS